MGAVRRLRSLHRLLTLRVRALPRRGRRAARIAITAAEAARAAQLSRRDRPEAALAWLTDARRRSPQDHGVARQRAQLLARTGQLGPALAEAAQLAVIGPKPANRRLHRTLQGRWLETDPGWRPVVPGPAPVQQPLAGRVLYLAKESMPHRFNGYCTRTHETLLAVREAGRDPVAVTLPGFPTDPDPGAGLSSGAGLGSGAGLSSVVDGLEYHHVMPGAQRMLSALSAEEYVQVTTTAFARELLRTRPQVLHAGSGHRGFDLALPGQELAQWAGLPWVYEVRSFFETTWTADPRYAENAPYYHRRFAAETRAMLAADVVVTLSGPMRDEIVHAHGVPEQDVVVVPNAVDLERFVPGERDAARRAELGLSDRFVLGYVSNLDHHREGQEVLLAAAARLVAAGRAVSVLLVGDGRRRPELEAKARRLGIAGRCVFTGTVPFEQVAGLYAQIDLFVVPRVSERAARMVSPLKPFEAMAMRVPVLVSDLPALLEIAGPGQERAFTFPAGDSAALAARVADLIDDPAARAARVEAAQRWVRAERTWQASGKAFDEVYTRAAERHAERQTRRRLEAGS